MIWSFLALYLIAIILTHLPSFQEKIGSTVAEAIGQELHTDANIGSINLGFLNRIIIDDVSIYDQEKTELLHVGRLSAKIEWLPLIFEGRIVISSVQLFGAHATLYRKNAESPTNFQFILDAFSSKDTVSQSSFDLRINSFIVRHSSVGYNEEEAPQTERLNPSHLRIYDISAHMALKALSNDSLNINVKRLAFKEKSGLHVNHLSFRLNGNSRSCQMNGFSMKLPNTFLLIDSLQATFNPEKLKETLAYSIGTIASKVTLNDLYALRPSLKQYTQSVELNTSVSGTCNSIDIARMTVNGTGDMIKLDLKGRASDLNQKYPVWNAQLQQFHVSTDAIRILQKEIGTLPEFIMHLGSINISGNSEGLAEGAMDLKANIATDIGALNVHVQSADRVAFSGKLKSDNTNLQELINNDFGLLAVDLDFVADRSQISLNSAIPQFSYKNYTYQNLAINGVYRTKDLFGSHENAELIGNIVIDDDYLKGTVKGQLNKNGQHMEAVCSANVSQLAPQALNLSDKWGDAVFEGSFDADITATSLNDAEGKLNIHHFTMTDSASHYAIDKVELTSGYDEGKHYLSLNGDIGEAELAGQFDWDTLPQSFINFIATQLPTLPGLPETTKNVTNNFSVNLHLINTDWLQRIFGIPFQLLRPMSLHADINDLEHQLNIDGIIPSFHYDNNVYSNAHILLETLQDSITCHATLTKLMDDNTNMQMSLRADAFDNQLKTSFMWDNACDSTDLIKGELNAMAQLYSDEAGNPEAHVHFQPSHTIIGGVKWNISPSDVFYTDKNLIVENFSIEHRQQHLTINGTASESAEDTITIDLNGIDVAYVLDLVNFHSVDFDGKATGRAQASGVFSTPSAHASLEVSKFTFEHGRMGTLHANATWNNKLGQIDIDAIADDGPGSQTGIKGYVSPVREDIMLDIDGRGTHIDFLQTYCNSFLKGVSGQAYGKVKLVGPLGAMDLLGTLVVDGQATVKPIGTTYTLQKDTVRLVKDDILLHRAAIYDRDHNTAYLSGGIHHKNLSNITFDLDVTTDRLLAYDFSDFGDEVICGSVVTAGHVDMHGRPGEVIINCNATPLRPTTFFYNAASNDAISNHSFISWNDKKVSANAKFHPAPANDETKEPNIPTDIYLNFRINATSDATVRLLMDQKSGDYITLNGAGILRASYHNKGAFQLYGTYTVDRGTYGITIQNIIKKNFLFNEGGTIVFGGNPMNASLRLQAVHTVNGVSLSDLNIGNSFTNNTIRVNCLMNILGQAGAPRIEFDLDMPTINSEEKQMIRSIISSEQEMNQQVLYLLGIGRFYTQGINNAEANTQEYDQTQLAMQSFLSGTLSSQINEVISHVVKNDNWNFGANISTGNEGWHNAEYEGLVSGRMFNNRLLINGQFGYRDNARQATPSFIGDFDIRYLLQPNGNLALKVYNQTNDRYFTHSTLNTQGIGIIIKRDFSNLNDLFFKNKK